VSFTLYSRDMRERLSITLLGAAAALLAGALFMEHVMGLAPCALCLMQRLWVGAVGIIAWAGFLHGAGRVAYPIAAAVAAVIGGGFSVRQLYLQHLPPDQVPSCGPELDYMLEVFPAADVWKAMTFGTGNCAEVGWTFLGLGIAGWALLGFLALLTLALLYAAAAFGGRRHPAA